MKHSILIIFVLLTGMVLGQTPSTINVCEHITIELPGPMQDSRVMNDSMTMYMALSDTVLSTVVIIESKDSLDPDSVITILDADANVFRFVEAQGGTLTSHKRIKRGDYAFIDFSFTSDELFYNASAVSRGTWAYVGKYVVVLQYSNVSTIDDVVAEERFRFLDSLKVK